FNLFYLLAFLSPCSAGFIVPSVRKAIASGQGLPQINKNNQQQHAKGWYHQLIDMNTHGLRGDIGSLPSSDDISNLSYKQHYATESSSLHGSYQYHPKKLHSLKASDLRGSSGLSVHQRNDRKFGSYHDKNILDNSLAQATVTKVPLYSTSPSALTSLSNSSHNTAPVGSLKACKRKI
ncbi:hypothetical protein DOY81_007923, partial [Sarcophaga bullata]